MAKTRTKVHFSITTLMQNFMTDAVAREIGEAVHEEVRSLISKGQSPVRGERRFSQYKNRKSYPAALKPAVPVNLQLSGEMLNSLNFQRRGDVVDYGFLASTPADVMTRARAHQEGTDKMAARPMVPEAGQEWAVSVVRKLKDVYSRRLQAIIKKSND